MKTLSNLKREILEEWSNSHGITTIDFISKVIDQVAEKTVEATEPHGLSMNLAHDFEFRRREWMGEE